MEDDFDLDGLSLADARTYVLSFVTAKKQTETQRVAAAKDVELWRKRVELAQNNSRSDLAEQAQSRLNEATAKLQKLLSEERDLDFKVTELKRRLGNMAEQPQMSVNAQALAEQLESVVGPDHSTTEQTEDVEAELALEALKRKLEQDETPSA